VALSDVLHRFRRFRAPPGPPARAVGVPSTPGEEIAAELAPLFAELDVIEAEARALREAAETEADEELRDARERAAQIMATAREHVDAERERALALRRSATQSETAELASAAAAEAAAIRKEGEERLPRLLDAVLSCIEETSRSGEATR
jgi:vacuolar-type H+-ATPase subunit H